jgi:hypothetical protein
MVAEGWVELAVGLWPCRESKRSGTGEPEENGDNQSTVSNN